MSWQKRNRADLAIAASESAEVSGNGVQNGMASSPSTRNNIQIEVFLCGKGYHICSSAMKIAYQQQKKYLNSMLSTFDIKRVRKCSGVLLFFLVKCVTKQATCNQDLNSRLVYSFSQILRNRSY